MILTSKDVASAIGIGYLFQSSVKKIFFLRVCSFHAVRRSLEAGREKSGKSREIVVRSTRLGVGVGVGWHLAQIVIQLATEKAEALQIKGWRDAKGEGASIGKPVISEVKRYDEKLRGLPRARFLTIGTIMPRNLLQTSQ